MPVHGLEPARWLYLHCTRIIGSHLWGGERDGSISIRDVYAVPSLSLAEVLVVFLKTRFRYTAEVIGTIPLFNTQTPEGHHADE
jgi:hypothetical protein